MKLSYTLRAGRDLIRLREFIREKNPQAAQKASRQLEKNIRTLVDNPKMGTPVEGLDDFRELAARNYIVRYRILPDKIVILNIWHEKENR